MKEPKFYYCKHCGNIIEMIYDSGVRVVCCGDQMTVLETKTEEEAYEKHLPVIEVNKNLVKVTVGGVLHPMVEKHYIQFIYLLTDKGLQKKYLNPGDAPVANFVLEENEKVLAAYEFCNIHGLWKSEYK
ncbi:MAG: desulfoferrodoxin family protein [Bacilli bacterium]|jgi:superoxide reductase|nr:desulfoferrodoxin family protein [Bacilli bacterium]MDD2682123.1 desulfoferrodoxin family protein [Bacilli bacterium]MDD3121669.1 desulfoferrodoxin family protein [Bacilli bacterium]MDD4063746.1 desulfoferrodoxin family protein [Bacilli bacterium]MDD4482448.1 desulfoferrodoxin family protein [Bacilli bacterium]